MLSRERYRHVLGVARTAERLARRYGVVTAKARVAAMLHDFARQWTAEQLLAYARQHGLSISEAELAAPVLLHASVAAHIARERFGVDDPHMVLAIERHTVAEPGMSDLEKIIYIADTIEPSRAFEERALISLAADRSLDEGLKLCIKSSMEYLTQRGIPIPPQTLALFNHLD
jgi:predicted HD superfamily hydrolase involved in NAD metabolism